MKKILLHIALILIIPMFLVAQEDQNKLEKNQKVETTKEKVAKPEITEENQGNEGEKQVILKKKSDEKFVDKDGNGIDDRRENWQDEEKNLSTINQEKGKQNRHGNSKMDDRKKDHFIDKDGDGLNDKRCKGMGLKNFGKKSRRGGRK